MFAMSAPTRVERLSESASGFIAETDLYESRLQTVSDLRGWVPISTGLCCC